MSLSFWLSSIRDERRALEAAPTKHGPVCAGTLTIHCQAQPMPSYLSLGAHDIIGQDAAKVNEKISKQPVYHNRVG
jgi:hypothetical protein